MQKETFDILSSAISDVGYWRWWIVDDDLVQLEFGGVQLLNNDTLNKSSKSAIIALRFFENTLLKFYNNEEENNWHIKLQENKIEPFTVDCDFFYFNNYDSINIIDKGYKNKIIIKDVNKLCESKNILTFKAGNVAVIAGGDNFCVVDGNGNIGEEEILQRNKMWWIYWKDYWEKKDTGEAYNEDYVCEVTIPIKKPVPQPIPQKELTDFQE